MAGLFGTLRNIATNLARGGVNVARGAVSLARSAVGAAAGAVGTAVGAAASAAASAARSVAETVAETVRGRPSELRVRPGFRIADQNTGDFIEFIRPDGTIVTRTVNKRLRDIIDRKITPTSSSDQETLKLLDQEVPYRYLKQVDSGKSKKTENTGAWFPYILTDSVPIDLTKYGIYKRSELKNLTQDNCFVSIFKDHPKYEALKPCIYGKYTSQSSIKKACSVLGVNILLHKYCGEKKLVVKYSPPVSTDETIEICLMNKHYFLFEKTQYKSSWIKNRGWETGYKPKKNASLMTSFALVAHMLENKQHFLSDFDGDILKTVNARYVNTTTLEFNSEWDVASDCKITEEERAKERKEFTKVYYADIETTTSYGRHIPYLFAVIEEDSGEKNWWWGPDCVKKAMSFIASTDAPLVYFHNLGYDGKFFIDKLYNPSVIDASTSKWMKISGRYKDSTITFHDTLAIVNAPLSAFNTMFNLPIGKFPDFPYDLYSDKTTVEKEYLTDDGSYPFIPVEYHIEKTIRKNKLKIVDHRQYAIDYCLMDVMVLRDGFMTFKRWIKEELNIDMNHILTAASLAHFYLKSQGCYEGVAKMTGMTREFVQRSVVGGRTTLSMNDSYKYNVKRVNDDLYDFDAVSLYPSAMMRMEGCVLGIPTFIDCNSLDFMTSHMYFVKIRITKVGRKLKLPFMSYVLIDDSEEGSKGKRIWENDMVGRICYVDRYTLEDWIRHHEIEFEPLIGIEFKSGYNDRMVQTMKNLFALRLKLKAEKNPAEQIYKLIMNSAYGKTIERPHPVKTVFVLKSKFESYMQKHYGTVEEFEELENNYIMRVDSSVVVHYSYPQVGSAILSMSKRIMAEVTTVADDYIYYTDTDSIFITKKGLDLLESQYPELVGKNPGQFHVDFSMRGTNVRAVDGIFLAPKTYCLKLQNDEGEVEYHIRMKGISKNAYEDKVSEYGGDYLEMFNAMTKHAIKFNLIAGNKVRFDFKRNLNVYSVKTFEREVGPF